MSSLAPMVAFDPNVDPSTISLRWKEWLNRFNRFLVAANINNTSRKRAMLLYQAGPAVDKIFQTLENTGEEDDYDTAVARLSDYFEPQKNVLHATYMFRQCTQASQESLAEYHVRLRTLAEKCDFGDRVDFEIKLQIVTNGTSTHLRKKALRDPDFTLKQMLEEGQRVEASTQQTTEIENNLGAAANQVNFVKGRNNQPTKSAEIVVEHTHTIPAAQPKARNVINVVRIIILPNSACQIQIMNLTNLVKQENLGPNKSDRSLKRKVLVTQKIMCMFIQFHQSLKQTAIWPM